MIGLDIGADSIKVVEATAGRDGITVTGLGLCPTPEGAFENGAVADPQVIGRAVRALLTESGIRSKRVVCSVSGQGAMPSVVIRVIRVANMSPAELKEAMKWEVEKQVPFPPTEVVMDYQKIERVGEDPNAPEMEVLLAVAQQEMINNQVSAIYASGLKPSAIDIRPLAASRSLIDISNEPTAPLTVGILDVGATITDLSVFEAGQLVYPSPPIGIAGMHLTQAIASALGVSEQEAETLKKERADVNPAHMAALPSGSEEPPVEPTPEPPAASYSEPQESTFGMPSGSFTETPDGPVFDMGDEDEEPQRPRIDLGADLPEEEGLKTYDLGGYEYVARKPVFDLSEDEPAQPGAAPIEPEPSQTYETTSTTDATGDIAERVSQALAPVLRDLVDQIRLNLEYYRSLYNNQVERLYLCGGTAVLRGLDAFLTAELGLPVVLADPFANVRVTSKRHSPEYLREISPLFPVSLGLAIRDMVLEGQRVQ